MRVSAIAAVEQGGSSIRRAAVEYGIPRSTLHAIFQARLSMEPNQVVIPTYLWKRKKSLLVSFSSVRVLAVLVH